jgi:hypothetical protein
MAQSAKNQALKTPERRELNEGDVHGQLACRKQRAVTDFFDLSAPASSQALLPRHLGRPAS